MTTPEVAVGGVVVHDGRLLLVQRRDPPGAGEWSVPGGRVVGGETLHEAVVREVREETGLEVAIDRFLGWAERIGPAAEGDPEQPEYHFVILDFLAVPMDPEPTPRAGDDASAVAWFDLAEVAELPLVDGLADFLVDVGVLDEARPIDLLP